MNHQELRTRFGQYFPEEPIAFAVAPGRVNLIGEHTDYNDGFVFPAAIDKQIFVAAGLADGPTATHSRQTGQGQEFDAQTVIPGQVQGWAAYAAGMAWVLREHTGKPMPNIRAYVDGTVPLGSGVSSSAAIEMAFGVLWNHLAGLGLDNKALALLAQKCENKFVGVNCGIMDQMASAMGKRGMAMFIDTRTLDIEHATIPNDLSIVICDTRKPRALSDSAYNERRSQCEEAARILGVAALRDATLSALDQHRANMSDKTYRRALHVITENDRCLQFRSALDRSDRDTIGSLMYESHESLRVDYEVSCAELDAMAIACRRAPGSVGARMTGAGFGGACVALVETSRLTEFAHVVSHRYKEETGLDGVLMACRAVQGAQILPDRPI